MPKPPKRCAYLVSASQKRDAVRVYAVLATTPDEALEAIALSVPPEAQLEIVGGLSRDLVKRLHLKPGEPLLVWAVRLRRLAEPVDNPAWLLGLAPPETHHGMPLGSSNMPETDPPDLFAAADIVLEEATPWEFSSLVEAAELCGEGLQAFDKTDKVAIK